MDDFSADGHSNGSRNSAGSDGTVDEQRLAMNDPSPTPRAHPLWRIAAAWVVVIGVVGFLMLAHAMVSEDDPNAPPSTMEAGPNGMPDTALKLFLALKEYAPSTEAPIEFTDLGSVRQRLQSIILEREFHDPESAGKAMGRLRVELAAVRASDEAADPATDPTFEPTASELRLIELVDTLLSSEAESDSPRQDEPKEPITEADTPREADAPGEANAPGEDGAKEPNPSLDDSDRRFLRDELGWYATLLLYPPGSKSTERSDLVEEGAQKGFLMLAVMAAFGVMLLVGTFILLIAPGLLISQRIQPRFRHHTASSGLMIETFAIAMVLFVLGQIAGEELLAATELSPTVVRPIAFFFCLLALLWPRFCGMKMGEIERNIGWNTGQGLGREILAAFPGYVIMVPLVVLGVIASALLMHYFEDPATLVTQPFEPITQPAHPIVPELLGGGNIGSILFLAAVAAPIVEETLLRGLLYRHLREMSARWRFVLSVFFSTLVSSVIFAVIHPQGWAGVPMLTAIATALCLIREWRDSLVAPMIMHGVWNAGVLILLLSFAS